MNEVCRYCQQWKCDCIETTLFPVTYDPAYGIFVSPDGSTVPLVLGGLSGRTTKEKHDLGKRIETILNEHLCK